MNFVIDLFVSFYDSTWKVYFYEGKEIMIVVICNEWLFKLNFIVEWELIMWKWKKFIFYRYEVYFLIFEIL